MPRSLRLALMLAPALLVVGGLFGGGVALAVAQSLGAFPLVGEPTLSLAAYRALVADADFYRALALSGWIAGVATVLSTGLGLGSALLLRRAFRGRRAALVLFQVPLPIPHLVGAIGILLLCGQSGWLARLAYLGGLIRAPADFPALLYDPLALGIILEYVWKSTSFIGLILLTNLQAIGDEYEAIARTLGATRWQRFRFVLLPLLGPGMLGASILVFAYTFGAFEVPYLLGQRYPSALPVLAYRQYIDVDLNARPQAMATSVVIAALSTLLILAYARLSRRALR